MADPVEGLDAVNNETFLRQVYNLAEAMGDVNLQGNAVSGVDDGDLFIKKTEGKIYIYDETLVVSKSMVVESDNFTTETDETGNPQKQFKYVYPKTLPEEFSALPPVSKIDPTRFEKDGESEQVPVINDSDGNP